MEINKRVCVVTGSRAEFGLLQGLMKEIHKDPNLHLKIVATGMHLSPEFGMTCNDIEKEGFVIERKIEMLLSSDTPVGISKSVGLGVISLSEVFDQFKPEIVVLLGDRFEILAAAIAAVIARIPIAHIHGGETTIGAIDEPIRHSITKMSYLHFTSTNEYRKRVIQLGEHPDRVFDVGALGVENIKDLPLLSKEDLEKDIGFELGDHYFLVTFHPVTQEHGTAEEQFKHLLFALNHEITDVNNPSKIIFTKANADTEGRVINQLIDSYVSGYPSMAIAFTSMGQLNYLSAMKHASVVVGNSSSGIIESPSFPVPTVNIGDRQKGRVRAENVIDCEPTIESIQSALQKAVSKEYTKSLHGMVNPYEKDKTAKKIKDILKFSDLNDTNKKEFFDIETKVQ